jgi:hypothetical protein
VQILGARTPQRIGEARIVRPCTSKLTCAITLIAVLAVTASKIRAQPSSRDRAGDPLIRTTLVDVSTRFIKAAVRSEASELRALSATKQALASVKALKLRYPGMFRDTAVTLEPRGFNLRQIVIGSASLAATLNSQELPENCRASNGFDLIVFVFLRRRGVWKVSDIYVELC